LLLVTTVYHYTAKHKSKKGKENPLRRGGFLSGD